jgi:hypothetical protein
MKIFYGESNNKIIDVTEFCYNNLKKDNIILIPNGDCIRASLFGDPIFGVLKKIYIIDSNCVISEYDDYLYIIINLIDNTIITSNENNIDYKITHIHNKLKLKYGSFSDELPEQKMTIRYLNGSEKVLEIGGNIGRNSLIIGYILKDNNNFVTLECDEEIAKQLTENRDLNSMNQKEI